LLNVESGDGGCELSIARYSMCLLLAGMPLIRVAIHTFCL